MKSASPYHSLSFLPESHYNAAFDREALDPGIHVDVTLLCTTHLNTAETKHNPPKATARPNSSSFPHKGKTPLPHSRNCSGRVPTDHLPDAPEQARSRGST